MSGLPWETGWTEEVGPALAVVTVIFKYGPAAVFFLVMYVFQAIGLRQIALRRDIPGAWVVWLPFGNLWILGYISDHYRHTVFEQEQNKKRTLLLLALFCVAAASLTALGIWAAGTGRLQVMFPQLTSLVAGFALGALVLLTAGLWLVLRIFAYVAVYDLFRSCKPEKAVLFLLVCVIAYMLQPVLVFILRNHNQGLSYGRNPIRSYQNSQSGL